MPCVCSEIPSARLWLTALGAKVLRCRLIAAVVCGDSFLFWLFFSLILAPLAFWEILHPTVQPVFSIPENLPLQPITVPWVCDHFIRPFSLCCSSKQLVQYFISHECKPSSCHLDN